MARNSRLTIRARDTGKDEAGQPRTDWHTVCEIWGDIRVPSGLASLQADALTSVNRASISVSKRADILPGMQAVHGATVYDIKAVLPDEQRRLDMFLVCEAVQ